jgi:hypothetical protein
MMGDVISTQSTSEVKTGVNSGIFSDMIAFWCPYM